VGTVVAMLRSVNVGGRNRLAMADLRALVSSLGFADATTYLQSGNVVFTARGSAPAAARAIESRLTADLGLAVPVMARSASQLRTVLDGNPLASGHVDPKTIHVTFLAGRPAGRTVTELERLAGQFGDDRFEVSGTHVYLHCPGGYGETKLNNAYLEQRLGVTATTRNWRTVRALAELCGLQT
jgi:uncharacterized protein (DUF1697 family)